MAYKPFATDKLPPNTTHSLIFSKDGLNLIVTETFITKMNPEQVTVLKNSYTSDLNDEITADNDKVTAIQNDLDAINLVYP